MAIVNLDNVYDTVYTEDRGGAIRQDSNSGTIASGTAQNDQVAFFRFGKGFRLYDFVVKTDDLSTGSTITADIGYVYDDATLTDDENYFADGLTGIVRAAGTFHYLSDTNSTNIGEPFVAEGKGYLVVALKDAATNQAGDIKATVLGSYDS